MKIDILAYFMVGFPWENHEEIMRTQDFMKKLSNCSLSLNMMTPYPSSELYEMAKKEGIIPCQPVWSDFYHQSPEMDGARKIERDRFLALVSEMQQIVAERNKTIQMRRTLNPFYTLPRLVHMLSSWELDNIIRYARETLWS